MHKASQEHRPAIALLGSGEFERWAEPADRWLIERARTGNGRVLVLPTASAPEGDDVFDSWAEKGLDHYGRLGADAEVLPLKTREDAEEPAMAAALENASVVFFSGGNPAYLAAALAGTRFWRAVLAGLARGMAFGGCSAGAHCLGERALDSSIDEFGKDIWKPGLKVFPRAYVGPHWDALDSFVPGLQGFFLESMPQSSKLLAIDESTAVIGDGRNWSVLGRASAHLRANGTWLDLPAGTEFVCDLNPNFRVGRTPGKAGTRPDRALTAARQ